MTIDSSYVAPTFADVHRAVLADASGEVFALNLAEAATRELVGVMAGIAEPPTVRVLARESVLKWLRDDFLIASTAVDVQAIDALSLRTSEEPFKTELLVTEESVVSLVAAGDLSAGLATDDAEFLRNVREQCASEWDNAAEFGLRTPARSRVYETLAAGFGSKVEADVRTMFEMLDTTRGDGFNEVMVCLLAAAKHEVQFYTISKWGEDVGLASKATFSRKKSLLEDQGIIGTEKVPIEVGRPRLRLVIDDERLEEADATELVNVAQKLLSNAPA